MQEEYSTQDERFMKRALALARRGLGLVSPNPAVGAVVVKNGRVVGEGYHLWDRRLHAEAIALQQAGSQASGADLYVTLEPCSHHGRTPPCVDAVIRAGIRRVFAATEDPDLRVSGRGFRRLKEASIEVNVGLGRLEAGLINEAYFFSIRKRRPLVTLKLAMTMDGRIATREGDSKWITGERARSFVHRLRYLHDSVLVGSGTLLADDPSLDVRWTRKKSITRIILDSSASCLHPGARIFNREDPILVFHDRETSPPGDSPVAPNLEYCGIQREGRFLSWPRVLEELDRRKIRSVLVEGGGRVAGSLISQGLVDRMRLFYSPMFIGADGLPGIGELDTPVLADAFRFRITGTRRLDGDLLVEGTVDRE